jgi:hypothetical protein
MGKYNKLLHSFFLNKKYKFSNDFPNLKNLNLKKILGEIYTHKVLIDIIYHIGYSLQRPSPIKKLIIFSLCKILVTLD